MLHEQMSGTQNIRGVGKNSIQYIFQHFDTKFIIFKRLVFLSDAILCPHLILSMFYSNWV